MNRKPLVISVLMVVILLLGCIVSALASEAADIELSFVEDSGDYIRSFSLLPEDAQDTEYDSDLYLLYGWLGVEEDGDFRYELDVDNADIVAARESGRTLKENVTFRYRDEEGTARQLTVCFAIQPKEADVPDNTYALLNDGAAAVSEGRLFSRDDTQPDEKEPTLLGVFFAGGEYMLNEDMELTYSLNNWSRAVQQLSAGEQSVQLMKFRLRADDGSTITRVVGITVRGVNDLPSVQSATRALCLDGKRTVSGFALAGSALGDGTAARHRFAWTTAASEAQYGVMTLQDDGGYTYDLDEENEAVHGLTKNSPALTETFTFTYTDKDGSKANGSVTVTIAYSDIDPQVVNQTATLTEDAGADNDDPCYVFAGNALTGSLLGNGTAAQHSFTWTDPAASDYGTVELNADGSFSFQVNNALASVQSLYPGVDVQQSYGYTYTDTEGDRATGSIIVTLKGANDKPGLRSFTHSFTEDAGANNNDPIYTCSGNALTGATPGDGEMALSRLAWDAENAAKYGVMTTNADGSYTYKLSNDSRAVQALSEGETANDVFSYTYTDTNGDSASGCVTVTVTGAQDAPTLEAKSASLSLGGTLSATGNALTNSTLGDGSEEAHSFAWTTAASAAKYGSMTLEDAGDYTYKLDENNAAVRSLRKNSPALTETFTFTYTDKDGGQANGSATITISYNDIHPVAATVVRKVSEDGTDENNANCLPLEGDVLKDCKQGNGLADDHSFTWTTAASEAQYGAVTLNDDGTYSYTMSAEDILARQSMKPDETVSETFNFTYKDADDDMSVGGSLTITILGANDAPV